MVKLDDVITEAKSVARAESLLLLEEDQTDHTIKLRLAIDREIFIQIYANESSEKLNLALIMRGNRIYGFDCEGGLYHLHPFIDPRQHIPADFPKSIAEFTTESLSLLTRHDLV